MAKLLDAFFTAALFVLALALSPLPGWAGSDLRPLKTGVWVGAVRGDDQGNATSCYLSARKSDKEFWILLKVDDSGLHIILYNETWRLNKGDTFRSRVRIDKAFDNLVDATIISTTAIDFLMGNDEPSFESVQAGRSISLETQSGVKRFKLQGTRKALNTLIDCADTYLTTTEPSPSHAPDYGTGVAAYNSNDFETALTEWLPLAKEGNVKAQNALGILYYNGQGVEKDLEQSAKWFQRAADQDYGRAQNNLGEMYRDGEGVPQDDARAVELFRAAALNGVGKATENMTAMITAGRTDTSAPPSTLPARPSAPASTLSLSEGFDIRDGRTILHPNEQINIAFSAPKGQDERSWIGFVLDDAVADPTPSHYVQQDMSGRTQGVISLKVPQMLGDYRLWMYDRGHNKVLAEMLVHIEVDKDSASLELPNGTTFAPGQDFSVKFRVSPANNSYIWVKIVDRDAPIDTAEAKIPEVEYIGHQWLNGKASGTLTFRAPTKPGRYRLRMQDATWTTTLTEVEFTVGTPPAPKETASDSAPRQSADMLVNRALSGLEGAVTSAQETSARADAEAAFKMGDRRAMMLLSLFYGEGIGGPVDATKSRDYLDQAADALLPEALFARAKLTAETSPDAALRDIRLAAAEGFVPALQVYATLDYWENYAQKNDAITPPAPKIAKGDLIAIQAMLNSLGYQAGPPLGKLTGETTAAIVAFQEKESLPTDGLPSNALRDQLVKALEGGN